MFSFLKGIRTESAQPEPPTPPLVAANAVPLRGYKVCNTERSRKYGVAANSLEMLRTKAALKLKVQQCPYSGVFQSTYSNIIRTPRSTIRACTWPKTAPRCRTRTTFARWRRRRCWSLRRRTSWWQQVRAVRVNLPVVTESRLFASTCTHTHDGVKVARYFLCTFGPYICIYNIWSCLRECVASYTYHSALAHVI